MAYEPTTWKSGDTITSTKLNKIENGIVNSGLVKSVDMILTNEGYDAELDCTWQQLYDWMNAGYLVLAKMVNTFPDIPGVGISGGGECVHVPILGAYHNPNSEYPYSVDVLLVDFIDHDSFHLASFKALASDEHPATSPEEPSEPSEPYDV